MSSNKILLTTGILLTGLLSCMASIKAGTEGETAGNWTMDLDAAKKTAAEKNIPILFNFSGSDWCSNCQVMDSKVFSTPEWAEFAKENLVQVLIDFPQDKSLVPEKYVNRNKVLSEDYLVQGFPTFLIFESDGETELGRIRGAEYTSVNSFIGKVNTFLKKSNAAQQKFIAALSPENRAKFEELKVKVDKSNAIIEKEQNKISVAEEIINTEADTLDAAEKALKAFKISLLSEEDQKKYAEFKTAFEAKEKEFTAWMETQPEHTPENEKIFHKMQAELMKLDQEVNSF